MLSISNNLTVDLIADFIIFIAFHKVSFHHSKGITEEQIASLRKEFESDPKNLLAQLAATKYDPLDFCIRHGIGAENQHAYTHKVCPLQSTYVGLQCRGRGRGLHPLGFSK